MRDAAICLGRAYALEGEVVKGHQRGRTIGVPTANLDCRDQLVPADGVYAGAVQRRRGGRTPSRSASARCRRSARTARQVEAHLIGFDGDLYGRTIRVELIDWVREQWKFDGVEALKAQMARDIDYCAERAGSTPGGRSCHA